MSLGNRGFSDPILGVNQYMLGRKVSQELSPGSGMKATFKIGSGKEDSELDEDLNNPLYFNKIGLSSRPSERDFQQQMSQLNLYGSQQSDYKRDETWKLTSQLGTSLADPAADLWRSSSGSQMSKASLPPSYNLMGVPQSSGRSMSSSQFSRSLSQPANERFNTLSGSSMQTTVSTGFQQSPSSSPTSGQTSPGSRGLLSMGQRGIIGQGLLNSSSSGHQQPVSQGLLSGGMPKPSRQSAFQSGMGSPSRNSPTFLPMSISQLQQQQSQLSSHSQQPPQRIGSFGSLNSLTSSSGSGQRMMPSVSSHGNFLGPSLQSAGLLSGGHDFQMSSLATGSSFERDFPALSNRQSAVPPSSSSASQPLPIRTGYGQVVMVAGKAQVEGNQEFQIHSEDFPALPGSQPSDSSSELKTSGGGTSYEQVLKDGSSFSILPSVDTRLSRAPGEKKSRLPGSMGIQTSSSGVITNIPAGMVTDQFGMIGLLTFIRAAETEPNLVTLALGSDLTTLGLNLNSTESLYHTFGSPFSDTTCRPHEIDFHVPQEYMINQFIRDKLAPIKLGRYGEDLLFYLYYTNCGDILQFAAAAELYARDYRYHKEERVWITRAPGMEPQEKTNTYERGTYYYFDPQTWRKLPKEFYVEYDKLEERPTAQAVTYQQQQ